MTDQKVTDLASATTPLNGSEILYVVQGGADRQATAGQLPISAVTQSALNVKVNDNKQYRQGMSSGIYSGGALLLADCPPQPDLDIIHGPNDTWHRDWRVDWKNEQYRKLKERERLKQDKIIEPLS